MEAERGIDPLFFGANITYKNSFFFRKGLEKKQNIKGINMYIYY